MDYTGWTQDQIRTEQKKQQMRMESVSEALLKVTEGPVSTWVDRMGEIAKRTGLFTAGMSWTGTPFVVSRLVVSTAASALKMPELEAVIAASEAEKA